MRDYLQPEGLGFRGAESREEEGYPLEGSDSSRGNPDARAALSSEREADGDSKP